MMFYVLSVAIFKICITEAFTIPVTTCKRNTTNYSACLKLAAQESWSQLIKGFPEIDYPPLDPYSFEKYLIDYLHDSNIIYIEIKASNITIRGFRNLRFLDVRPYFLKDAFQLEADVLIPEEFLTGDLKIEIRFGSFRVGGEGHFTSSRKDIRVTYNITGHVINDIWTIEHFSIPFLSVKSMQVSLDHLFDDQIFNYVANIFMNLFGNTITQILLPFEMLLAEPWFTCMTNRLFSKVSFSKLFP